MGLGQQLLPLGHVGRWVGAGSGGVPGYPDRYEITGGSDEPAAEAGEGVAVDGIRRRFTGQRVVEGCETLVEEEIIGGQPRFPSGTDWPLRSLPER